MSSGRRRSGQNVSGTTTEDQAFSQIASEAETRLAAKRAARAEARTIRMKELEKQQKELDEEYEKQYQNEETPIKRKTSASLINSNTSNENSYSEIDGYHDSDKSIKQVQDKLVELEEKYKKAMVQIAQLDDEKQTLVYQTDDLKDKLEDGEDECTEARYELKEKNKEIDRLKRQIKNLEKEIEQYKEAIEYRDNFIAEKGLSLFEDSEQDGAVVSETDGGNASNIKDNNEATSQEGSKLSNSNSDATVDRTAVISDDKELLVDQIKLLQSQLAELKAASGVDRRHLEIPTQDDLEDIRREFARQANDMKIKMHKLEQENTRLEGLVMRLESQVKRYKSQAEAAEATEETLKTEKRKLQRELRKAQDDLIEIQTAHDHIQKRYEKLKSRRKDET
ncbi:leucine-rich repeat flightless-interacting protein 2-like isoform X1 [Xenia sp. Carnegie-2017]|uniref:leucine-rich repeat flightless-interacting protein 2-like isoform X1 n=1 Tax=Xenia sp. Carnegie-2017 TaxID=2897299 RepID=UPI001F0414DB|nr:leucine-rich repeat flightless-interacting protein 2-like isoform X1 [Xenia sp. Carnegie-2017]